MGGPVYVLLPPPAFHLADLVLEAGCTPVLDATTVAPERVPDGAWVRIRPGHPAPGSGPVVLAEDGAAVLDRPTWLEAAVPRELPPGFAGFVLKGREAGGLIGDVDGFEQLGRTPDPSKVILAAGAGPDTAGAAAAMGAAGVWVSGAILACPELSLPAALIERLRRPDDEVTHVVQDQRFGNPPTSPALRRLISGEDVWTLTAGLWEGGDLRAHLWPLDQGASLAHGLAERHGTLPAVLQAYVDGWNAWSYRSQQAVAAPGGRTVHSGAALIAADTVAGAGRGVGSAVLWQEAAWLDRPVTGPVRAAVATGLRVAASADDIQVERQYLRERAAAASLPIVPPTAPVPAPQPPPTPVVAATEASMPANDPIGTPAIAIIGMGCLMPGAGDFGRFWSNIKDGVSAIGEVPRDRWDPELYFDADPETPDKSYTKIGGFIRDFRFDAKRFRIPPRVATQVDPVQQLALHAVHDALVDANLQLNKRDKQGRPFDRERCGVIFGNSLGGELKDDYALRVGWPDVRKKIAESPALNGLSAADKDRLLADLEVSYKEGMPRIDEDSMPGELSNVISGRVANAFDLRGANFTTDAACASSLAAVQVAVKSLQDRDIDIAVTGGADRSMNVATYVKFCKIGALSPDHSSPFDASANGFVMGEGAGVLILKRLEDAVADNDKIYAVIRGIGASSDGKGKGITAPNPIGQRLALERAYEQAGVEPSTVDLIEAHGTSTVVGDAVELTTFSEFVGSGKRGDRGPIRVGSVKSMVGHLKSAAGAAALIKAAAAIHDGVYPPSLGFQNAREDVDLDKVPVRVQTKVEPWQPPGNALRRAGVSAFGFGGTNFHVVLEQYAGQALPSAPAFAPTPDQVRPTATAAPVAATPATAIPARVEVVERPLPTGVWATSALDRPTLLSNLQALREGRAAPWNPSDPYRIAAASDSIEDQHKKLDRAIKVVTKEQNPDLLRARNIYFEDVPVDGKVAFFFTGQGSQYLDMGLDLAKAYPIVQQTFDEADRIVAPTLGKGITDFIALRDGEDAEAKERTLRQTEYSQPATLTLDVAILRLLASYGVFPDMVAGHSLGEYGACVAAGIMDFEQALLAVSARGREMASIKLDDPGKMAGLATNIDVVEEVLAEVQGYVIAANKNCPSQTVIAGASDAVEEAIERFQARGVTVYPLPVSHAFHSAIVAPASDPLRNVLRRLGLNSPRRPITTNVTSEYYPSGDGAVDQIIDTLAKQISAPVEWTAQLERMYDDGARIFVECGPKRALTGFAVSILKRRPHRAYYTNHPKRGGVWTFRDALAGLLAAGMPVRHEPSETVPDLFSTPEPRKATTEAVTARLALVEQATEATPDVREGILRIVANKSGYAMSELDLDFELEADLGIDTVKQAEVFAVVRETYGIPREDDFRFDQHKRLRSVISWAARSMGATRPAVPEPPPTPSAIGAADTSNAVQSFLESAAKAGLQGGDQDAFVQAVLPSMKSMLDVAFTAAKAAVPATAPAPPTPTTPTATAPAARVVSGAPTAWPAIVCTGASVGLPGGDGVFHDENLARILHGENRISHIGDKTQQFMDLGLVRLVKDSQTGQGSFLPVESDDQVIRLAGVASAFDLTEYGVPENLIRAFDITTQLAVAAAVEALRDAGIPLQRTYKLSASGKRIPTGWSLPEPLQEETGVIFGSAFPGYASFANYLNNNGDDGEGRFDRRFLFKSLSMGHSQIAQILNARGPNTQVNAACASATQALAIAQDWIRVGRCKRVIVVSSDNVTGEDLFRWIGGGFMAAGAASTNDIVEETALPFDARRHGLVLGMGANALIVETDAEAQARGVTPVAELLEATIVNSAYHGTRLHPTHIADSIEASVQRACAVDGVDPAAMARSALFMSHETYTPARGGSAQAEIAALRKAFGDDASDIVITNTKGYTGHPMGAGIEDTVAVKALQYGIMPPVANYEQPDPALGNLRIGRGEHLRVTYALRLAAGFGSQLAFSIWKARATDDNRTDPARRAAWLRQMTGFDRAEEYIEQRTLRVRPGEADRPLDLVPAVSPAAVRDGRVVLPGLDVTPPSADARGSASPAPTTSQNVPAQAVDPAEMQAELIALIAQKTGYDPSEIEADFELEADLGIDTVKQAEIFGEIRERHGLARDDDFRLADFPTVEALAGYLANALAGGVAAPAPAPAPPTDPTPAPKPTPTPTPPAARASGVDSASMIVELTALIAEKTGYDAEELESDFELEADLGIDTVKQAEIFSEIRERHGLARDDDFRLADYPTIEALAGYLADATGGSAPPPNAAPAAEAAPPVEPTPPPKAPAGAADATAMQAELTALIAEKTGYDAEELEPDFELEADLGIDTVKQAEIFSEIRERHGLARDDDFRLADYPTIEALAGYLATATGDGPPIDDGPDLAKAEPPPAASPDAAPAPSSPPVPANRAGADSASMQAELTALIADKTGYDPDELEPDFELEADLGIDTVKQAEIFSEIRERHGLDRDDEFRLADYPTIEALAGYLAAASATSATPEAEASAAEPAGPPPVPRPAEEPKERDTIIPNEDGAAGSPTAPLPRSFRLRWPVAVPAPASPTGDLSGQTVQIIGDGKVADAARVELEKRGATFAEPPTIVVDVSTDPLDLFAAAQAMGEHRPARWLTLTRLGGFDTVDLDVETALSQGSRAGFAKAIDREWPEMATRVVDVPPKVAAKQVAVIIGDELCTPGGATEVFRSGRLRHVLAYDVRPPPAQRALPQGSVVLITGGGRGISAAIARVFASRSAVTLILVGRGPMAEAPLDLTAEKQNIRNALKATGSRVTPAEIERRLNPLRKAEEVRANVAAMQALGATVAYERADLADASAVEDLVQRVVNEHGRLDVVIHGAGVEESRLIADKNLEAWHRVYDGKAIGGLALARAMPGDALLVTMGSVAGRFGNAGQVDYSAANDGLARMAVARGLTLHVDWTAWDDVGMAVRGGMKRLLTDRGVDLLPADAGAGLLVDFVCAQTTGEVVVAGGLGDFLPPPEHPLLDAADNDGTQVVATRSIRLDRDGWVGDHAIGGTPVLPGVIGLELMAAASLLAQRGQAYAGAQNVRFAQPAKLYGGDPLELTVQAKPLGDGRVEATLSSERTLRTGRQQRTDHFTATIVLGMMPEIPGLPSAFLPDEVVEKSAIYQRFFHGPQFQVISGVQGVSADALLAEGMVDHSGIADGLDTEPLVLEAAFQAAGLHHMIVHGEMALPSRIDEVQLVGPVQHGELLTLLVRRNGDSYDVDVDTVAGPVLRLRGYAMATLGPLGPEDAFPPPEWERPTVFGDSGPTAAAPTGAIARATWDDDPQAWLTPEEQAELTSRGTARRQRDRLAGRIAAKRALGQLTGEAPLNIRVETAPSGEPIARVPGWPTAQVSITHRNGVAVAIATTAGRVGVDVEAVEPRPRSFAETWFSDQERRLIGQDPERLTIAWSAKESVQKVLGQGMAISPAEIRVVAMSSDGTVEVSLTGRAAECHRDLGGGTLTLVWRPEGDDRVLVEAHLTG